MHDAWGRALISIGVIVAFLTLGALEILTARHPASEPLGERANPASGAAGPWQDFLEMRPQFGGHDRDATSVNQTAETDRTVVAAEDGQRLW